LYRALLQQARELALRDPGKPRQVNLRRAVSAAYYALFHALIDEACRLMFGAGHEDAPYRHVLGRAFTHSTMKQACTAFSGGTLKAAVAKGLPATFAIPVEVGLLARAFFEAQDQRNLAEYDWSERFRRSEVLQFLIQIESALNTFLGLAPSRAKKFFLVCLLAWSTLAGR